MLFKQHTIHDSDINLLNRNAQFSNLVETVRSFYSLSVERGEMRISPALTGLGLTFIIVDKNLHSITTRTQHQTPGVSTHHPPDRLNGLQPSFCFSGMLAFNFGTVC